MRAARSCAQTGHRLPLGLPSSCTINALSCVVHTKKMEAPLFKHDGWCSRASCACVCAAFVCANGRTSRHGRAIILHDK